MNTCPISLLANGIMIGLEKDCPLTVTGNTQKEIDELRIIGDLVIAEWHKVATERNEAREAAREMYTDVAQYDPCNLCPGWKKTWPWLE